MTPEPQVGDLLNITLTGVRVIETDVHHNQGRAIRVALTTADGSETWGAILLDSPSTTVEIATTPADELRQAALTIRSRTAIEVETGDSALAELLDYLADYMGDDGAHESEIAGPTPRRATSVYNRQGAIQPAWTAALDLARAINGTGHRTSQDSAWPPHQGDLWKDCEGYVWFAVEIGVSATDTDDLRPIVELVDELGDRYTPDIVASENGPLTLVSRKPADQ